MLILVDGAIDQRQDLIDGILNSSPDLSSSELPTILILDPSRDGIEQISEILRNRHDLSEIHIFSHASAGSLQLGTTSLDRSSLNDQREQVRVWGQSLTSDGDILLYGCR
ncbi:MAG: DUF4347 domain-containing protein, partial [Phycisphaerae bacterium]